MSNSEVRTTPNSVNPGWENSPGYTRVESLFHTVNPGGESLFHTVNPGGREYTTVIPGWKGIHHGYTRVVRETHCYTRDGRIKPSLYPGWENKAQLIPGW